MSTNAIIGLIVAVVVIGGGAWYWSQHQSASTGTASTEQSSGESQSGTGTFAALLALGGSLKCEVTVDTPSAPAQGTTYIANGDVRSDVAVVAGGKTIQSHMIKSGDYFYSWSDEYPQGVKMKIDAAAPASSAGSNGPGGYDPNAQVQYSCAPWAADASLFTVPEAVTFMDMSAGAQRTLPSVPAGVPSPY